MIRVGVTEAQAGDVLARSIANPAEPDKSLLKRGVVLTGRLLEALRRIGVRSLWLEGDGMGYLEDMVREERFAAGRAVLGELKETFSKVSGNVSYEGGFAGYRERVMEIFTTIRTRQPVYCLLDDVRGTEGDILFHGGNVCYLSMMLGLELDTYIFNQRSKRAGKELASDMAPLGLGALLHDVGKLELPDNVRGRATWELSGSELELLRQHTQKGFDILREQIGAVGANIALCHHRNFDGSGYPDTASGGKAIPSGEDIHIFSRVVSVANAYDELVGYCDYLPIEALEELNCARRHHFDPKILSALNRIVPPFGFGEAVQLSTGHHGMVVDFDPRKPFRPTVVLLRDGEGKALPESKRVELDLASYPQVNIIRLRGRSIAHLLPDDPTIRWEDME